ncbi:peptidyl-alpha-hydroxyglycine alpha-amidating lyase 1 isoform X2 [Uranotaenia lowii]|uniref:peptidyl-alpha-hydroxyglycine alpha-amidating lyase 1 isoform X2 n=1 Tax=Uranotaenia lowii TaxID=190385 RepID=UPI00247AF262|nr:peptidyl-alpha-hydroxyglycine alpha-amidating lyase 1 isoform X2 [Uranotaenia lowii]XP_055608360.1 peptidyl-alpha-hydroxyglycine alpha-amidating lyase 1 isoform X2 [Uranotaenia lowii]
MLIRWLRLHCGASQLHQVIFTVIIWIIIGPVANGQRSERGPVPGNPSGTNHPSGKYEYEYHPEWPRQMNRALGSVSAVAFDSGGGVVIFHRGSHVWDISTFDEGNRYLQVQSGPIQESTLLTFNGDTGGLIKEWGANLFYMPHGLTIDRHDNFWLTDVAMHQVFKFNPKLSTTEPSLTLGIRFEPGSDRHHFCKPTSVAVLDSGDFFVADGYCNGRVMKYASDGTLLMSWGKNSFVLTRTFLMPDGPVPESFFAIPHALTYAADKGLLCVADREQGRIQCFHATNGTFHSMYSSPEIGHRLFSVKYVPLDGGMFYVINGPPLGTLPVPVTGFLLSMNHNEVVAKFHPNSPSQPGAFNNPHELAVSPSGDDIYVAELLPTKVHKFKLKRSLVRSSSVSQSTIDSTAISDTLYASSLTLVGSGGGKGFPLPERILP